MAQYYKLQEVQYTPDAELFRDDEQEDLTIDAFEAYEDVCITHNKEVDIVLNAGDCTEVIIVQAQVGADGCLYMRCEQAEELLG